MTTTVHSFHKGEQWLHDIILVLASKTYATPTAFDTELCFSVPVQRVSPIYELNRIRGGVVLCMLLINNVVKFEWRCKV